MGRRLVVESIAVRDFASYAGEQSISLNGRGPLAVVGPNGAGKSTLVSKALVWCLYGQTAPERMGSGTRATKGRDVVREGAKDTSVRVMLRDDDGKQYEIRRVRKLSGSEVVQLTTGNGAAAQDQAAIDALIGADYDVFVRTVVRAQNDPWNFAEATDARKREILDAVSGANALAVPYERVVEIRKQQQTLASATQARIDDANRRLAQCDPSAEVMKLESWDRQHAADLATANAEVENVKRLLDQARKVDEDRESVLAQRRAVEAERPTLDREPYRQAERDANAVVTAAVAEHKVHEADMRRMAALAPGFECSMCGQVIAPDASIAQRRAQVGPRLAEAGEAVSQAAAHLKACQTATQGAETWLRDAEAAWKTRLDALPLPGTSTTAMTERAFATAIQRADDLARAINPWREAVEQVRRQRESYEREIAQLAEAVREIERTLRIAQAWEDALSPKGVRAHLSDGALAAIEAEANRWLAVLSDGRLSVEFPVTKTTGKGVVKEEIQTVLHVRDGAQSYTRDFLTFSGGERRRVNLAVDLGVAAAFSRGGALALSLLVLDEEQMSGLDEQGKHAVVTALHHVGVADVVLVDHDPRAAGVLPRTVRVSRGADGWSTLDAA